jgi:crossover junction endodeoxyribonuclease RuvC
MLYIGVDPSLSNTGIVVIDETGKILEEKLISSDSKDDMEYRITFISNQIIETISKYPLFAMSIEGLSYQSSGQGALQLAGLHFHIRCMLYNFPIEFNVVPPSSWKKTVFGKGNLKKDLILKEVYKKFGADFNNDNLADAYCIAMCTKLNLKIKENSIHE